MMEPNRLALSVLAILWLALVGGACGRDKARPLALHLNLDRNEYFNYEPIFAEWVLVNKGSTTVRAWFPERGYFYRFEFVDREGVVHELGFPLSVTPDFVDCEPTVLAPGQRVYGRAELSYGVDAVFPPRGEYRVSAVYRPPAEGNWDGLWSGATRSSAVSLSFVTPRGEDAKAQALVTAALAKPGSPARGMIYYSDNDLCRGIIASTKSNRFAAIAYYFLGVTSSASWPPPEPAASARYFRQCIASEGNQYLRGLSYYYLLRCRTMDPRTVSAQESSTIAAILAKEYPDTWAAINAKKLHE